MEEVDGEECKGLRVMATEKTNFAGEDIGFSWQHTGCQQSAVRCNAELIYYLR